MFPAPDVPGPQETPLTTALAFLLTNEDLRRRFRGSPQATARALGVQTEDLDTFLALDPDALERQADDIAEHRGRQRFASPSGTFPLDAPDLLEKATNVAWQSATTRPLLSTRRHHIQGDDDAGCRERLCIPSSPISRRIPHRPQTWSSTSATRTTGTSSSKA